LADHESPPVSSGGSASGVWLPGGMRTGSAPTGCCRGRRRHGSTSARPTDAASVPARHRCHSW